MSPRRLAVPLALGLAAWTTAASAASPPPPATLSETLEVNLVNLDVVVTDRGGDFVAGLGREDFEVLDEGRPVEISHFRAVHEAPRGAASQGRALGVPGAPEEAAEPLQLAVLLDNVNTRPGNRDPMLRQLGGVLAERLRPGDRVLLASYDRAIHVHLPFTADREALARGLERLATTPALGQELDLDNEAMGDILEYNLEGESSQHCGQAIEGLISRYTYSATHRVTSTTRALGDFVAALGAVPGRKALLYVSDGLELRPGAHLIQRLSGFCLNAPATLRGQTLDIGMAMRKLTAAANAARVTLYTVDSAGARQELRGGSQRTTADAELRSSLQDSLAFLAADTGGRAVLNAIDLDTAMTPVLADAGSYYSLAYPAPGGGLGELRRVEVRVKRRGVEVRYRHAYHDRSAEDLLAERLLAALWLGDAANEMGVRLEPAGEPIAADGVYHLLLRLGIPIRALALVPAPGGVSLGRVTVFVTTEGEDGARSPVSLAEVPISIPEADLAAAAEQLFGYEIRLAVKEGRQRIAVGVRDEGTATTSVVTHEIRVGPPESAAAR